MPNPAAAAARPSRGGWIGAAILLASVLAYWPVRAGGFIWDDDGHVTAPALRSLHGLLQIWTRLGATQQYYPLTHSAFWLEFHAWGEAAAAYHWTNILLHAAASCLVVAVVRRLSIPGAGWAGLLFALHPVAVESVAWISEEKNTLSAIFYLLAVLAYLRFDERRARSDYAAATVLFVCALCCKTVTSTLPGALLVIAWWRRGRLVRRDILPLVPWFVVGAAFGLLTAWVEKHYIGAQGDGFQLSLPARLVLSGRIAWFYLGKNLWPSRLLFIYPHWTVDPRVAWQWLFPAAAAAALAAAWRFRRRSRAPLAAALFFLGTLFPALGFFNVYPFLFSYVADHFQYLARLGVLVPAGALVAAGIERARPAGMRTLAAAAGGALLLACAALTRQQTLRYRDGYTLYTTELAENPDCWLFHHNLGTWKSAHGDSAGAIAEYREALRLNPRYAESEYNWANELNHLNRPQEALAHFERALAIRPDFASAAINLGVTLLHLGRLDAAFAALKQGEADDPHSVMARLDLAAAELTARRYPEAAADAAAAAALEPGNALAEDDWAQALENEGDFAGAAEHFARAAGRAPEDWTAQMGLGRVRLRLNDSAGAVAPLATAARLRPRDVETRNNLAVALFGAGRPQDAVAQFEAALELAPDRADIRHNLDRARRGPGQPR